MQEAFQTLLFVGCPAARLTCQRDVGELVIPLSAVSETLADLALLDLSEESETLVGESVNLDSGSAACGSIGSLSLPEVSDTGKLIIGKLSEFIGILTANCCTAILRPFQRCF